MKHIWGRSPVFVFLENGTSDSYANQDSESDLEWRNRLLTRFAITSYYTLHACKLSHVWLFANPWTVTHQAPLSMGFPSQEYWSGLSFPSLGDLPDPGIELTSPALAGRFFTTELPGKPPKYSKKSTNTGEHSTKFLSCCLLIWAPNQLKQLLF